jgi:hypothetical protein
MNLSIHALAENTSRFQKHPITPLGEKVSFLSKENVCFMKLLHNTYISQKKTPNSFILSKTFSPIMKLLHTNTSKNLKAIKLF